MALVVTSGALALLDPAQLAAVLAHERAHLAGRHHLLLALTRALAAVFPAVPVFSQGPEEVARLAEMCADDTAARQSGRRTLLAALLTMGTGQAVPAAALAVTASEVTARVQRLLDPPRHARRAGNGMALITVTALLASTTAVIAALACPLAVRLVALG
jgi:Zn-dependent protease with chaperone function